MAADGKTTLHALGSLEARGSLFTGVGTEVYTGMIIGECARENNLEVNPVREKKLTNVRASGADEKVTFGSCRCCSKDLLASAAMTDRAPPFLRQLRGPVRRASEHASIACSFTTGPVEQGLASAVALQWAGVMMTCHV